MSLQSTQPCGDTLAKKCNDATPCQANQFCMKSRGTSVANCTTFSGGQCWATPPTCPVSTGHYHVCPGGSPGKCLTLCDSIQNQQPFYQDGVGCP
jgi:hypothetical protein